MDGLVGGGGGLKIQQVSGCASSESKGWVCGARSQRVLGVSVSLVLRTPGECLKILCLKNLLYCSSFNAAGVCRDLGIIFDTCRKELCLH